ncbi:hypothetical protein GC177_10020 [bacterium]|nr:hypothetical protein [bacterium]
MAEVKRICVVIKPTETGLIDALPDALLDSLFEKDPVFFRSFKAANDIDQAVIEGFDDEIVITLPEAMAYRLIGFLQEHPLEGVAEFYPAELTSRPPGPPPGLKHIMLPSGFKTHILSHVREQNPDHQPLANLVLDAMTNHNVDGPGYYGKTGFDADRIIGQLNASNGQPLLEYAFGLIEDEAVRAELAREMGFGPKGLLS